MLDSYSRSLFIIRGGSSAAATAQIERFMIIVNGWKPLTIIAKRSIWDVAAALDPPPIIVNECAHTVKDRKA